ncbi:AMP-binding protein [Chachezhania sediminis]|uniref:AMP-binding protein n=1 Tax=Chachezhania sediminis TaxID=2599291 RepID=UPI00131BB891|nr:AMP-binding protein [Chachezhania sediminis]
MSTTDALLTEWLDLYGGPEASAVALLCDDHPADREAFTFVEPDGSSRSMTFGELAERSRKLATVLADKGIRAGDRVPVLMGKREELPVTLLALWRLGAVFVPLFTAFATGAIQLRVEGAGATLLITEATQRQKADPIPGIEVFDIDDLTRQAADAAPRDGCALSGGDVPIIQIYTSGTTGKPKGVAVPTRALASFRTYLHFSMDIQPDDVYWNAADPGWAYGLYFALLGPLILGQRGILVNAGFTPQGTIDVLRGQGVTNLAGAPTMFRALRVHGGLDGLSLRRVSSAGEPLTPDLIEFGRQAFSCEIRDHYGQTELGMVLCNHWNDAVALPLRPGSMGQPLPGFAMGVQNGQIAVDTHNSPLFWFQGYHEAPDKTAERYSEDGRWCLTGDTGRVDEDGYYFFTARDDDVILASGYRIGPFDVESVLITHPVVSEVAVVGRPDPEGLRGEIVVAVIVAIEGAETGEELAEELKALVRDTYSKHAYPRHVEFTDALPKTPSGKVQRFILRNQ